MALDTTTLENSIKIAFLNNLTAPTTEQESQVSAMAATIAAAMAVFVRGATITYTTGLVDGAGPVTGVFGNTIT